MEDLTSMQVGGAKKNLYMIGILILIALILFIYFPKNIEFSSGGNNQVELRATFSGNTTIGSNLTLVLEIRNTMESAVTIDKVVMVVYANEVLTINPEEVSVGTIGPDEYRRIDYELIIADSALAGKYIIEVKTDYSDKTVTDSLELVVES